MAYDAFFLFFSFLVFFVWDCKNVFVDIVKSQGNVQLSFTMEKVYRGNNGWALLSILLHATFMTAQPSGMSLSHAYARNKNGESKERERERKRNSNSKKSNYKGALMECGHKNVKYFL